MKTSVMFLFCTFQVNQSVKLPSMELTTVTGMNLQYMIDDCLIKIFSLDSLTLMDLCSIAGTCTRFQEIIQCITSNKLDIRIGERGGYAAEFGKFKADREHDITRMLENFGSFLSQISVAIPPRSLFSTGWSEKEEQDAANVMLNLVTMHCHDSLERLSIIGVKIPRIHSVKPKPIFEQLQHLYLKDVSIEDKTLFANFNSLVEIRIDEVKNCSAILKHTFPKLERFFLKRYIAHDLPHMSKFFLRHKALKTIDLSILCDVGSLWIILQAIGGCQELIELSVCVPNSNAASLEPINALKSLKTLTVGHSTCEDFNFIPGNPLSELHLIDCRLPKDSNQYVHLAHLTTLEMDRCYDVHFADMIGRLINLKDCTISRSWKDYMELVLDEETYFEIVDIVKGRPEVLTLKCKFDFTLYRSCTENLMIKLLPLD